MSAYGRFSNPVRISLSEALHLLRHFRHAKRIPTLLEIRHEIVVRRRREWHRPPPTLSLAAAAYFLCRSRQYVLFMMRRGLVWGGRLVEVGRGTRWVIPSDSVDAAVSCELAAPTSWPEVSR